MDALLPKFKQAQELQEQLLAQAVEAEKVLAQ
jgi:hypothetical protein